MQDNDYNYRHDQNMATANKLRNEVEDIRFLVQDKTKANIEYQAEVGSVQDQISRREQECVALQREIGSKTDMLYDLRNDADARHSELTKLRDEKAKDKAEINRLREAVHTKERVCSDQDAKIQSLGHDLARFQEKANDLTKLADIKNYDFNRTSTALANAVEELNRVKDEQSSLMAETKSLQTSLDG